MTEKTAVRPSPAVLKLKKRVSYEQPVRLRYVDKKGRYILQEKMDDGVWRNVPFVGSLSAVVVVTP